MKLKYSTAVERELQARMRRGLRDLNELVDSGARPDAFAGNVLGFGCELMIVGGASHEMILEIVRESLEIRARLLLAAARGEKGKG